MKNIPLCQNFYVQAWKGERKRAGGSNNLKYFLTLEESCIADAEAPDVGISRLHTPPGAEWGRKVCTTHRMEEVIIGVQHVSPD